MAKSKNTSNHNQASKNHRNGIFKPVSKRYPSMKGVDPKFLRNLKFSRKHNVRRVAAAQPKVVAAAPAVAAPTKVAKK